MNNETAREMQGEIQKASAIVGRQWPGVISAEEVEQEIWIRLTESGGSVKKLREMDETGRKNSLVAIGHQIASRTRNDYDRFTANVYYGVNDVRKRLDDGLLTAVYNETDSYTETLTEYLDMAEGFKLLKEKNVRYADVIVHRFVFNEYDSDNGSARNAMSRAVESLTDRMNQVHRRRHAAHEEGPGTRKAISNAHAHVIKTQDYSAGFVDGPGGYWKNDFSGGYIGNKEVV